MRITRITLFLDKRYKHVSKKFPVKLRVNFWLRKGKRDQLLFGTGQFMDEKEFKRTMKAETAEDLLKKSELEVFTNRAYRIEKNVKAITPELFKQHFENDSGRSLDGYFVKSTEERKAKKKTWRERENARSSFSKYDPHVTFNAINVKWLKGYYDYMRLQDRSITAIGMYMRQLRAVLNEAISEGIIDQANYPFGRHGYKIRTEKKMKMPISKDQVNLLRAEMDSLKNENEKIEGSTQKSFSDLDNELQSGKISKSTFKEKAKTIRKLRYQILENQKKREAIAFWLFSYNCHGMNPVDIFSLRKPQIKNINGDKYIAFIRDKSSETKIEVVETHIYLTDEAKAITKEFGKKSLNPNDFIFDVFSEGLSIDQLDRKKRDKIKWVNIYTKRVGSRLGITGLKWGIARHTFSNVQRNSGMENSYIQYCLAHSAGSTTEHYLGSLYLETLKNAAGNL